MGERARALGEPQGALPDAPSQKPVRAQGSPLAFGYSYPAVTPYLWQLSILSSLDLIPWR
jgi:hypothetical protein